MNPNGTDTALAVRALAPTDLNGVVAIDAAIRGHSRSAYVQRRLAAAVREPALHAQFAACDGTLLVGYILARVLHGEFGHDQPALRLEMVGVQPAERGHGAGAMLFDALSRWALRHGIAQLRTAAHWNDTPMVHWLDAMSFVLAPGLILGCAVDGRTHEPETDTQIVAENGQGPGHEIDFGLPQANDFERQAQHGPAVRAMATQDLRAIVRIDRSITGRDRTEYIAGRLSEAMDNSAIRVSLAACRDGAIVGYMMARADLGDFGRTAAVAVIDTIGVDTDHARQGVGRALLRELFANLGALHVDSVETIVPWADLALQGFFQRNGFTPTQSLPFMRRLEISP
ncbi:MAG: GNAT family N-acetyltransferase [Burkholderiaceae bacterium]